MALVFVKYEMKDPLQNEELGWRNAEELGYSQRWG
jgi:hypothetical protein